MLPLVTSASPAAPPSAILAVASLPGRHGSGPGCAGAPAAFRRRHRQRLLRRLLARPDGLTAGAPRRHARHRQSNDARDRRYFAARSPDRHAAGGAAAAELLRLLAADARHPLHQPARRAVLRAGGHGARAAAAREQQRRAGHRRGSGGAGARHPHRRRRPARRRHAARLGLRRGGHRRPAAPDGLPPAGDMENAARAEEAIRRHRCQRRRRLRRRRGAQPGGFRLRRYHAFRAIPAAARRSFRPSARTPRPRPAAPAWRAHRRPRRPAGGRRLPSACRRGCARRRP